MSTFPIYSAENEEGRQKAVSEVMESILEHLTGFSFSRFRDENFGYNEEYGTEIGTEPMRHLSFEQGDDAKSSSPFQRFHLDECRAITQQVPDAFDLGTTPVHLNCLAVSSNYFALGSDCGALFLFNRKINKSVRPLRTSFDEVITCLQLYESLEKQRDYLAIGHKSGTLILLYLPSSEPGGNRKMKQSIQEDSHRGHAICAISWADGSKLFSADESGMITMTHVDFLNEEFINVFVCSTNSRIRSLQSFDNYLVWCVAESFKIVDVNHNCEPVFEISPEIDGHISGVTFAEINEEEILIVLTNNGHLIGYGIDNESKGKILFHKNLESIMNSSNANDVQFHGSPTRQRHSQWSIKDCSASRLFIPQNVVYNVNPLIYYLPNKMLVCHLDSPSIEEGSPEYPLLKIELFHFDDLLSDATSFKVLDIAYANENGDELFILTDAQKILRLATSSVPNELVFAEEEKPSVSVLFNSLSLAAAKSSRHLFGKIEKLQSSQAATAGMQFMDNFLVGSAVGVNGKKESSLSSYPIINNMENVRENEKEENAWTSARLGFSIPKGFGLLSEERSTKIASNFQNIVDHLKVSNLMTDFNHSPLSAEQRQETLSFYKEDDQGEFASTSSTAGDSNFFSEHDVNSEEQTVERVKFPPTLSSNINVNVSRKSRAKRIRLPEIDEANLNSGDGLKHFSDKREETFAQGQNDEGRLRSKLSSSPQYGKVQKNPEDDLPLSNINLDKILKVIGQTDDAENLPFGHDSKCNPTEMEDQHLNDSGSASEDEVTSRKSLVDTEYDNHLIKFNDDEEVTSLSVSILPMEPQDLIIESRMAEKHERKDVAEPLNELIVSSERIDKASTPMQDKEFTISDHNKISSRSDTNSLADDTEIIMDSIDEAVIAQSNMYSLHKSGYQIHSATPSCSSSANESSLERNNADYLIISGLVNHRTDIWTQLIAPYQICCMGICENYIAICPSAASGGLFSLQKRSRPLYRLLNTMDNGVMGGSWMPVKISGGQPTSSLAVNDSGNILWRIDSNGFAYSPVTTDPFSPVPSDNTWIGQTGEEGAITSVALTTKNAWYSTKKGVYVQLNLPEMGILFRTECPFELTKLAASDQAVWALRSDTGNLVVRIGLQHCPMGVDWVEDNLSGLPRKFVSIALYGQFGFGLDSAGNLFMINGVTESTPFGVGSWFQICSFQPHTMSTDVSTNAKNGKRLAESAYLAPFAQWQLKVGKAGVFINAGHVILAARQPLTGHIITRVVPHRLSAMDNFTTISAGGFCGESNDAVYVSLQPTAEIFVYSVRKRNFTSLPAFSHDLSRTAKYMSSSRSYLFVLDDVGTIYYRHNLRDGHSFFTNGSQPRRTSSEWDTLSQIPTSIAIISLAISNTSLWVITSEHRLYWMDVSQIETADMNSWIEVDKPRGSESDKIDQVRSSSTGKYVWIFVGQTGLCWARIDVNESHRQGRAWSQASSDVQISDLAVAENAVWCLSKNDNELHRLRGLCLNNPAGHYWKPMRHCLKAISVDAFENRLWALDEENRIVKHEMQIYPPTCLPQPNRLVSVSKASENYRTNDSMQEEKCSVDKLYKDEELDRISLDPLQSWCLLNNSNEDREEESDPGASTCEENSLQELRYTSSLKPNSSNSYLYGSYLYL